MLVIYTLEMLYYCKVGGDSSIGRLGYTVNYYEYTMSAHSGFWKVMQRVEPESGICY